MRKTTKERFDDKWIVEPLSGCWLWTAAITHVGYGRFKINGGMQSAHRMAWMLYRGEIPEGMFICHHCDVKICVNPNHLFVGTRSDNQKILLKREDTNIHFRIIMGKAM